MTICPHCSLLVVPLVSFVLSLVLSLAFCLAWALPLYAQTANCRKPNAPNVALDWREPAPLALRSAVARSLAAGLDSSGIGVCSGDETTSTSIARIELEAVEPQASWRLRVHDDITGKTMERTVALTGMPSDSWSIALAVYIEELLQASWTELKLAQRVYLAQRARAVPAAVTREVARALPVDESSQRSQTALRIGLGGFATAWTGGLTLAGAQLAVNLRALPWLEPGLRLSYASGLATHTQHGTIDTQLLAAGLGAELVFALSDLFSLRWPQTIDFGRLTFRAQPQALAGARDAVRSAIFVAHGLGLRIALSSRLALSTAARFCWALLPAEATDEQHVATGIARVGGQLELMVDATF